MSKENTAELMPVQSTLLPVTQSAVKELKMQRELLAKFVKDQLREADFTNASKNLAKYGEGDFGIIPGTKKRCLLKPGAEKLLRLFGLGVRFRQTDKEIDKAANFALYTYRAEVYSIKTGQVVSECEATANSQEVKYKERTVWRKNGRGVSESTKEETPIFDVLNTLQKMAQKRALIGATLLATGASEYFTQDMLDDEMPIEETRDVTPEREVQAPASNSAPQAANTQPMCCGREMILSKYVDKELGHKPWYCMQCRSKKPSVPDEAAE